jgi:predicted nuclease of predicted toxin-antitoxin system
MIRFIVDAQLPPALARWLSAQGHEAEHVIDFGGDGTTDQEIWDRAMEKRAVILSKDEDFSLLAIRSGIGPQVIWIRTGNIRRTALISWLENLLPFILSAIERGERVIEID